MEASVLISTNVRHGKQFAVISKHAKTSLVATLAYVLLALCRPTIATAKTSTSANFIKTVDLARQTPSV